MLLKYWGGRGGAGEANTLEDNLKGNRVIYELQSVGCYIIILTITMHQNYLLNSKATKCSLNLDEL